jgi:signal transduction histidine kinase
VSKWGLRQGAPWVAEAVCALLASVGFFALSAVLVALGLPLVPVVILGLVAFDTLVVLTVAHFWGIPYAVPIGVASAVALDWYFIPPTHPSTIPTTENSVALAAYLLTGVLLGELAARTRRRADVSEEARLALANEQAALRRVATLVAHEPSPAEVFAAVTEEAGLLLSADVTSMLRYETDGTATVVAVWSESGVDVRVGTRLTVDGENVAALVLRTERPARIDGFPNAAGPFAEFFHERGVRSCAGTPIVVEGLTWGLLIAASLQSEPLPPGTEYRIGEFTELVATAISNAETRAELRASRARIVAAGDETRRRLERDLHDGAQQRLVSLALDTRAAEAMAPREPGDLQAQLSRIGEGLTGALDDLRELSHGIHPAILSEGGLRPALKALARRSAVPVELDVRGQDRLPEQVEVAVYYVVAEALANAAKHARASVVQVDLETEDAIARLSIRDDGVGGADLGHGSGLVGLRDRVEALGGRIEITSPSGRGTSLTVALPFEGTSPTSSSPLRAGQC